MFTTIVIKKRRIRKEKMMKMERKYEDTAPAHCRPSPENPPLQLQVNAPSVLEHSASLWQSSMLLVHSLISEVIKRHIPVILMFPGWREESGTHKAISRHMFPLNQWVS